MKLTVNQWKKRVSEVHPETQFVLEDGTGNTYGEVGEWTAFVGPDMQADVVGVYTDKFCSVFVTPDDQLEFETCEEIAA